MLIKQHDRRRLLKSIAIMTPTVLISTLVFANTPTIPTKQPGTTSKWLPDADPTAKALSYEIDATKAQRVKKGDTEGKDQHCNNCQLYTKGEAIEGKEAGKCLMLPSGAVHGQGWCKSWVKKT